MSKPYSNRLNALNNLIDNPHQSIARQVCESFFQLWVNYRDDNDLHYELKELIKKQPGLIQEFEVLLQKYSRADNKTMEAKKSLKDTLATVKESLKNTLAKEQEEISAKEKVLSNLIKRKRRRTLTVVSFAVFLIVTGLYTFFFIFRNTANPQSILPDVSMYYFSPKYLLKGEENTIDVTITNLSQSQPFNGIITLIFTDSNSLVAPIPGKNLSATIKDLHPTDKTTEQIKFTLPENSSIDELEHYFQAFRLDGTPYTSINNTVYISAEKKFKVFPVPYVKTIVLGFAGFIGFITALINFWDQIKKILGIDQY